MRKTQIHRREWLDVLADLLRDHDGNITKPNGHPYEPPLVDDLFGNDPDMRWLGYYMIPDDTLEYVVGRSNAFNYSIYIFASTIRIWWRAIKHGGQRRHVSSRNVSFRDRCCKSIYVRSVDMEERYA